MFGDGDGHAYPVNTTTHDMLLDFADGSPSLAQYADIGGLNRIGMVMGIVRTAPLVFWVL